MPIGLTGNGKWYACSALNLMGKSLDVIKHYGVSETFDLCLMEYRTWSFIFGKLWISWFNLSILWFPQSERNSSTQSLHRKQFGQITVYIMQPSSQFANGSTTEALDFMWHLFARKSYHAPFPNTLPHRMLVQLAWMQLVITCRKFPSTTIWCITSTVSKGESSLPDRVQVELHLSFTYRRGVLLTIRRKIETHFHTGRKQFSILHDWVASFPAASVVSRSGAFAGHDVKGSMIDAQSSWILLP